MLPFYLFDFSSSYRKIQTPPLSLVYYKATPSASLDTQQQKHSHTHTHIGVCVRVCARREFVTETVTAALNPFLFLSHHHHLLLLLLLPNIVPPPTIALFFPPLIFFLNESPDIYGRSRTTTRQSFYFP